MSISLSGSLVITGSIVASGGITGSFSGSATTSSYALTASFVNPLTQSLSVSGSITATGILTAQTLVVQTITSSIVYSSGSNIFGNQLTNVQQMTGSVSITGSFTQTGANTISSFSGSVGIGTTAPISTLAVAVTSDTASLGSAGLTIGGASILTTGNVLMLNFTPIGASSNRARAGVGCLVGPDWGTGNLTFYTRAAADSSAMTTADERMRITNTETTFNYNPQSGSLLSGYNYLNFGGGSIMYRNSTDIYIGSNAKYGSAGTTVACYTSANGMGMITMDGGTFNFQTTTGSVTAGTAYGMPIRMTIASDGTIQQYAGTNQATGGAYNTFGNLFVASTTAQGTDIGGSISIGGKYNGAGAYATFARIQGKKENGSSGQTGGYLAFETNTDVTNNLTERMRIVSNGAVTIASSIAGEVILNVQNSSSTGNGLVIGAGSTSSHFVLKVENYNGTLDLFQVKGDGTVRINQLTSNGTVSTQSSNGTLYVSSDANLKIEDGYIENGLQKVLALKPRYFYWKDKEAFSADRQLGFYAQEVNAISEETANTPADGCGWGIYDRGLVALLTSAIQEQQALITSLQEQITELKNK